MLWLNFNFAVTLKSWATGMQYAVWHGYIQEYLEGNFSLLRSDVDFQSAFVDFFSAFAVW